MLSVRVEYCPCKPPSHTIQSPSMSPPFASYTIISCKKLHIEMHLTVNAHKSIKSFDWVNQNFWMFSTSYNKSPQQNQTICNPTFLCSSHSSSFFPFPWLILVYKKEKKSYYKHNSILISIKVIKITTWNCLIVNP